MLSKSDFDDEVVLLEARSFVDRADEINRKIRTIQAKQNAYRFFLTFIAFLCIGTAGALLGKELVRMDRAIMMAERV